MDLSKSRHKIKRHGFYVSVDEVLGDYAILTLLIAKKYKLFALRIRFCVSKMFKDRAAYGIYNNLVHELRTDRQR